MFPFYVEKEITMTPISERQRECFFLYKKENKLLNILYTRSLSVFKKQDNSHYVLYTERKKILCYTIFHYYFELENYIQKA